MPPPLAYWVHDLDPFLIRFHGDIGIRYYGLAYAWRLSAAGCSSGRRAGRAFAGRGRGPRRPDLRGGGGRADRRPARLIPALRRLAEVCQRPAQPAPGVGGRHGVCTAASSVSSSPWPGLRAAGRSRFSSSATSSCRSCRSACCSARLRELRQRGALGQTLHRAVGGDLFEHRRWAHAPPPLAARMRPRSRARCCWRGCSGASGART